MRPPQQGRRPRPVALAATLAAALVIGTPLAGAQEPGDHCLPGDGTRIEIVAENNKWDRDCLAMEAEKPFKLRLENRDTFAHNLSIYRSENGEALFTGEYVGGLMTSTYDVPGLPPGDWYFRCDIHPSMEGTFSVVGGAGETPAPSPTQTGPGASPSGEAAREGRAPEGPEVLLEPVATGMTAPVFMTAPADGSGRLFVVDQIGLIHVIEQDGTPRDEPFLDVRSKLVELNERYDERGLLGLAFHPDFRSNGRFFVYYSAPLRRSAPNDWNHTSHLSEFRVSSPSATTADADSEKILMRIDEPQANHNGGHIAFGPDGFLYIPLGDGGNANDVGIGHPEGGNAQTITTLLGSVLRIDVDSGDPYAVPDDNPFAGDREGADEIYAYGFRNPYHLSFDSAGDRELFVADAGQDRYEEVSIVTRGANYGWNIKEGTHCFDPKKPFEPPEDCPDTGPEGAELVDPVIEYNHVEIAGSVVIGGYVYRGDAVPYLRGAYVFGDYSRDRVQPDGVVFAATREDDGLWPISELRVRIEGDDQTNDGTLHRFVLGFGEDERRELYVGVIERGGPTGQTGAVYRFAAVAGQEAPTAGRDGGGPSPWLWVLIGVALVAIVIVARISVLRARNRSGSAPD